MKPTEADFNRIKTETGADKVIVTRMDGSMVECDLFFIRQGRGATVQAAFDVNDPEQFIAACEWVSFEVGARLDNE